MAKKKYYAVISGRNPGIYNSWDECKKQVEKFPNAKYKGFDMIEDAQNYIKGISDLSTDHEDVFNTNNHVSGKYDVEFYVDGSFYESCCIYGYGIVAIFKDGSTQTFNGCGNNRETKELRNVAGEMLGALYATKWAKNQGYHNIAIHYDYMGIECWVTGKWKAKNKFTMMYAEYMQKLMESINIDFIKVKAHSGVKYNELADSLAKEAIKNIK